MVPDPRSRLLAGPPGRADLDREGRALAHLALRLVRAGAGGQEDSRCNNSLKLRVTSTDLAMLPHFPGLSSNACVNAHMDVVVFEWQQGHVHNMTKHNLGGMTQEFSQS